jgi:hypothetical protein
MSLTDQPKHEMNIAEVSGTQKSADPLWKGRDWGTFEGKASAAGGGMTVEGTYKFTGGDGEYRGLTGGGKFKTVMKSETDLECSWDGNYELAKAQRR